MVVALPSAIRNDYKPYVLDTHGWWLILCDVHVEYHDVATIELAVKEAKRRAVKGIILNGDILDFYQISDFTKDPTRPRITHTIEAGKQFLAYLRDKFPEARLVYKEGNHDERLDRYLMKKAPELYGLPGLNLPSLLGVENMGVEYVGDKRVIHFGALNIIHGHEYSGPRPGVYVNAARAVLLKAVDNVLVGHWHQKSYQPAKNIRDKIHGAWSVACACDLHPKERPQQPKWENGFALAELMPRGKFHVDSYTVDNGEVF